MPRPSEEQPLEPLPKPPRRNVLTVELAFAATLFVVNLVLFAATPLVGLPLVLSIAGSALWVGGALSNAGYRP